jgi:hypothetical protein
MTEGLLVRINGPAATAARGADILGDLLRTHGVTRHGLFRVTVEPRSLPDGSDAATGYVVDESGRIFFFWLDWNIAEGRPDFIHWRQTETRPEWLDDAEYVVARHEAGLLTA